MTTFFRVLEVPLGEKAASLLQAIRALASSGGDKRSHESVFEKDPAGFAAIPGSPFAYWVREGLRALFSSLKPLETERRTAKCGAGTLDDFRFLRLAWEPARELRHWIPLSKGGAFGRFYSDLNLRLAWADGGAEVQRFVEAKVGSATRKIQAQSWYFRPGLTWPSRTDGVSFRVLPRGCIFGAKGPAVFVDGDSPSELLALSAVLNSAAFCYLVSVQLARTELAQSYEVGLIQQTPVPTLSAADTETLAHHARRAWALKRQLDSANETSHAFLLPFCIAERAINLNGAAVELELSSIQRRLDDAAFALYGISAEDRASIEKGCEGEAATSLKPTGPDGEDGEDQEDAPAGASRDAAISWIVGIAFARFDPRLATGERAIPPPPEPFDPLPSRSPGMFPEGDEPAHCPDILVDDDGHPDDLAARVETVAENVQVDVPENLRAWLAGEFFPLHIRMYSRSRRKAPIYWQLATPSAGYSVWLYIHAFSKDTLFRVQNDYVAPKLAHEDRRLESLTSELRDGATAAQRKALAAQEALVEGLRAFLDEVKRVAPLWKPDLDDGVVINFAPLWRLVPQNKAWQKELKATWDALCEGKYDWAHLAMHLWPERVVPKCAKDRSLAIAHGLEDVFWVEGADGKWTARKTPTRSIGELVRERTSLAVKSALKSLLEAPVASGKSAGRKGGGRRKAVAAAEGGDA